MRAVPAKSCLEVQGMTSGGHSARKATNELVNYQKIETTADQTSDLMSNTKNTFKIAVPKTVLVMSEGVWIQALKYSYYILVLAVANGYTCFYELMMMNQNTTDKFNLSFRTFEELGHEHKDDLQWSRRKHWTFVGLHKSSGYRRVEGGGLVVR